MERRIAVSLGWSLGSKSGNAWAEVNFDGTPRQTDYHQNYNDVFDVSRLPPVFPGATPVQVRPMVDAL